MKLGLPTTVAARRHTSLKEGIESQSPSTRLAVYGKVLKRLGD